MSATFALFHRVDRPGVRGALGRPTLYYFDRCTCKAFGEEERWETWKEASRSAMQAHANRRIDVENKRLQDMYTASVAATPEGRPRSVAPQQNHSPFSDGPHFRSAEGYGVRLLLVLARRTPPEARAEVRSAFQQQPPPNLMDEARQRPALFEPRVCMRADNHQQPPAARASPAPLHQSTRKQRSSRLSTLPLAVPPPGYYEHLEQLPSQDEGNRMSATTSAVHQAQPFPSAIRVEEDTSSTRCHRCDLFSDQQLLRCTVGLCARDAVVSASDEPVFVCQSTITLFIAPCCLPNVCP